MAPPRRATLAGAAALVGLSLATRLPALLNAAGTNSDAAIVGLEARHILAGQWTPLLWGSTYQTSADATWAAVLFRAFGATPLVLMLSALSLHVALTVCVYCTLRRRLDASAAFVASLPLVFTTACVHSYALYPPREMSLALAFAALWAIDSRRLVGLAAGGALAVLAVVADPYASIFLPAAVVLAALVVLGTRAGAASRARAMSAFVGGALAGAALLALLVTRPGSQHGVASMSPSVFGHNARLLWHECLPWAVGTKVFAPVHVMDYVEWKMPTAYALVADFGAVTLAVALASSAVVAFRRSTRAGEPVARALATVAFLTIVLNLGSFLVSRMVMDQFSMRYLAASVLVLPFALAPLVARLGSGRSAAALAPYLFVAGAGGWLAHGPWVRGPLPVRTDAGRGVVEARLHDALEARHVEAAIADYWAAYRLDFLWREAIPVAPYHVEQDRHRPYRDALLAAKRFAYIHDRDRSLEDEGAAERELTANATIVERFTLDGFDVVVLDRSVK